MNTKNKNKIINTIIKDVLKGAGAFLGVFLFAFSIVLNVVPYTNNSTTYTENGVALDDLIFVNRLTQAMNSELFKQEEKEQMAFVKILEDNLLNLSDIEGEVALNQAVDKLVYDINNPISNEDLAFVEKLENILTTDDELAQAELINEFNNAEENINNEDLAFIKKLETALNSDMNPEDAVDVAFETDNVNFLSSGIYAK